MIAFTILGLVVFWCWCFEAGYWLALGAEVLPVVVRMVLLGRQVRRDIDVYAGWIAAMDKGAAA